MLSIFIIQYIFYPRKMSRTFSFSENLFFLKMEGGGGGGTPALSQLAANKIQLTRQESDLLFNGGHTRRASHPLHRQSALLQILFIFCDGFGIINNNGTLTHPFESHLKDKISQKGIKGINQAIERKEFV